MTPQLILLSFLAYTLLLFAITWFTARKADNQSFYIGNKTSTWYIVAYGMIGASLSGVTFMSVPGWVKDTQFTYLMVVFGYFVGYIIIANVLMPMYYRLNLTSIYTYLEQRFGFWSYKTGSFFFILSRVIGASLRMFLVVNVLQVFIFDAWNISFIFTASMFILLIILYTFKGGIKTIIWTDTLQTTFMLGALVLTIVFILRELNIGFGDMLYKIVEADYSRIVITDWTSKRHFIKQFFSGVFIAIVMTGLDQEMMQKNLSCRNLKDAKKNMLSFSMVLVLVNMLFLFLGAILLIYVKEKGINISDIRTDDLFSTISIKFLGPIAGLVFVLGLISAAYPSADGALTSLTTSFCIDILGLNKNKTLNEKQKTKIRYIVHIGFALLLLIAIVIFRSIFYSIKAEEQAAVVSKIFTVAGYTYGPLLGLYTFGLFTKLKVRDHWVPVISIISPILCYLISENSIYILNGYKFGFELLIVNGLITYFGLWLARKKEFV